ncbi:MAG TPA: rhomboid family intramembrane serine protease [Planctomycetota bacterium]|nr:rhomboid family intramembrane serine protease [Planctomycetota bacterium]OQC19546.1 MAG: Rhomboid family protein [Planctomycetes bacterium ADurb.Bin069]NMD36064.1 rhomboid family intramembrane serine protease [Planctomycetota bacterium]HNR99915.1 rhomboid family intramembrane serine protease [Planctomycetota bacterium]HNU26431.1 rhomboid family intramembrane serine protease [Planctomycetota bacterium]
MIPLYDRNRPLRTPVITFALIAANVFVFLFEITVSWQQGPEGLKHFFQRWGVRPVCVAALLAGKSEIVVRPPPLPSDLPAPFERFFRRPPAEERIPITAAACLMPLFTCMFLHGGWGHLIGNMWFLWIFGDNVEDRLGRLRFLVFYLATGVLASCTQIGVTLAFSRDTLTPMIGASGAVSAVLGAYWIAFPYARVVTLLPFVFILPIAELPAWLYLILWFLFAQLLPAVGTLGSEQGIAFWAHIGGFAAGCAYLWRLKHRPPRPPGRYVRFRPLP